MSTASLVRSFPTALLLVFLLLTASFRSSLRCCSAATREAASYSPFLPAVPPRHRLLVVKNRLGSTSTKRLPLNFSRRGRRNRAKKLCRHPPPATLGETELSTLSRFAPLLPSHRLAKLDAILDGARTKDSH